MSTALLVTAAVAQLEATINHLLQYDPGSRQRLQQLEGQLFHFQCLSPALSVYLQTAGERLYLYSQWRGPCDVTLSGQLQDFVGLIHSEDAASYLINSELTLRGSSQSLIELQTILATLDIDWEAALCARLGDVPGHQLSKAIRAGSNLLRSAGSSGKRQLLDYLRHESQLFPARFEQEHFFQRVDQLRLNTDRAAAMVRQLQQQRRDRQC